MLRYSIKHLLFYSEALWVNSSGITLFTQADSIIDQNMMMAIFFRCSSSSKSSLCSSADYIEIVSSTQSIYIYRMFWAAGFSLSFIFIIYELILAPSLFYIGRVFRLVQVKFLDSANIRTRARFFSSLFRFIYRFVSICRFPIFFPVNERKKLKNGQADTERERACVCCKC